MNIVTKQISAGAYDANYFVGADSFQNGNFQIYLGYDNTGGLGNLVGFFGFLAVTLRGRVFNSNIQLYRTGVNNVPQLKIAAIAAHDAAMPNNEATAQAALLNLTTAQIDWDGAFAAGWNTSPDISTILQELVKDYGVVNSRVIIVIQNDGPAADAYNEVETYDDTPANSAKLNAEWTFPAGNMSNLISGVYI